MAVRQLTFAIGDIHGCLDQLRVLLHEIEAYAPAGRVIFLGDLIDRGPESRGVVELVMAGPSKPGWTWLTLKGNHEEMLWGASRGESDVDWWLMNGGQETLVSYNGVVPGRHLKWIKELPTILVERYRIFVHAGIDETLPLEQQGDEIFLWIRRPDDYSGDYWGSISATGTRPAWPIRAPSATAPMSTPAPSSVACSPVPSSMTISRVARSTSSWQRKSRLQAERHRWRLRRKFHCAPGHPVVGVPSP